MSQKSNFELMADYNQWMNKSIYKAASKLSNDELLRDRGAFFNSILGTLNHILVGDIIWLKRFANHPSKLTALDDVCSIDHPPALNSILYFELGNLTNARIKIDGIIRDFAYELTDNVLLSTLSYRNTQGEQFAKNMGHLIQHFFNHQTHHRGQVSTLLSQAGAEVGMTDLLLSIPNEKEV